MTDELEAQNEQVEAQTPTEETPTQETDSTEEAQPQATEEQVVEQGETKKPTRSERRVEQLLKKLKERPQVDDFHQTQDEPLIRPEEMETGVDPSALEQRINSRLQNATAQTRQQIKAELAYENEVKSHMSDLESVMKDLDPRVEKLAVRQYQATNYQLNPLTGQPIFVPTVKFSEIVNQIKGDLEDLTASRVAESAERVARIAQEGAVQPGTSGRQKLGVDDLKRSLWKNPEAVARELEGRLGYSEE